MCTGEYQSRFCTVCRFTVLSLTVDSSQPEVSKFFLQTQQKTSEACGIHIKSVKRITAEGAKALLHTENGEPSFTSPRKTYKRLKYATGIDDFDEDVIRRIVHEFYDKGEFPTSLKILSKYKEKTGYKGSKTSMWRILKQMKFRYKKCNDGRRFLMERNDIVAMRVRFLTRMVNLRTNNDDRPVVYLDETWVNQNHTRNHICQDSDNFEGFKMPTGKGSRLIICHAGSGKFGFVKNSKLVFRCTSTVSEDYHSQMNSEVFKEWFTRMLRNLEEPCVIVMDNASYHSVQINSYPKSNAKKIELQEWLKEKEVDFSPMETMSELRERIKRLISQEKKYELDEIALSMGHEVVRLPLYHCQYNPIELIWAQVKGKVAEQNTSFKMADVEQLVHNALDSITTDDWRKCVLHCNKLQDDDFIKEGLRDKILEPIIMTINPDDSSESEDEDNY
ncbi:uncharacterized protein LOC112598574 [Melanaphis sacchari]|uniref:uncharacterized protein LOC112598574 n=1 Tax=Melanaphis sacchari TaxID=742174 RepID=UPI000DC14044|nr:uncharacterized protein LOC112598574 [Melanaphis sacchari]